MPAAASAWILLRRGIEAERMICKLGSVSLHRNDRQSRGKRSLRRRSNDCPPGSLGDLAFVWKLSKPTYIVTVSSGTIRSSYKFVPTFVYTFHVSIYKHTAIRDQCT